MGLVVVCCHSLGAGSMCSILASWLLRCHVRGPVYGSNLIREYCRYISNLHIPWAAVVNLRHCMGKTVVFQIGQDAPFSHTWLAATHVTMPTWTAQAYNISILTMATVFVLCSN